MKRVWVFLVFSLLFSFAFVSAGIQESFSEVEKYIDQYDSGELTAPQLMVYVGYARNQMYESGDGHELTESEVERFFDKIDREGHKNYWDAEYQKVFEGEDFNVVFKARSFVKNDREYYESREDSERYYYIDYDLVPTVSSGVSLEDDLEEFLDKIEDLVDTTEKLDYESLQEEFSGIMMRVQEKSYEDSEYCFEFAKSLGYEEMEDNMDKYYDSGKNRFEKVIDVEMTEDCWMEFGECEEKCEESEYCYEDYEEGECQEIEICEPYCEVKDVCTGEGEDEVCESTDVCEDECRMEIECDGGNTEKCETEKTNCYNECEEEEVCNEWEEGRLSVNIECMEDGAGIWLNAWGDKFEKFQPVSDFHGWNCESEIESLVTLRRVLQEDFNEEFLEWYFNEFIGEDYMKIMNGGDVLHDIVWKLINIDERVADSLHCSETGKWPEGFERIDIAYDDGNTHFEVWEKFIPMEGMDTEYYTTMYKYYWAPDKEMAKNLLNYMVENEFVLGPEEIAKIKSDEGQMALIETLAEKYGGSLDVKLTLKEEEGEFEISKYLQINPEVAVRIHDEDVKTDISVKVDFDVLYDFIISMSKMEESQKINGPYWVQVHEMDEGPGNFFGAIGLMSKFWREGVTITPKHSLIKLFFSAKDVASFMASEGSPQKEYPEAGESKISGEVVLTRE